MDRREIDFDDFMRQMKDFPLRKVVTIALVVVIALLVLWLAFSSFYTVNADERGVVRRFGKYLAPPSPPGLHFKLPGIDSVDLVKVDQVKTLEFGFATKQVSRRGPTAYTGTGGYKMLTGDQNVVSVEWIVHYKIKDPADFLFKIKGVEGKGIEDTIRDVSEAAMRLVVGDSSATEVLTARREEIAYEVRERLQTVLDRYESGIDIQRVQLQNVIPPTKEVQDSFNEVNRARQEKDKTINNANKEYQKAIPEAEGEGLKVVQEAEGFKQKRVNEARGDVAMFTKILEEYQNSREVMRKRFYLEAIQDVLPKLTQIYVIDEMQGGPLQVLNLKDLMGGAAARQKAPAPAAPPARTPAVRRSGSSARR